MTKPTAAPPGDSNMKRPVRGTFRPDQGWSWMALAAAALGLFLVSTIYSTGIFNIAFLEEFHMSKQATAWIGGLPGALLCLTGPLSSAMTNRLGPRVTVIIGGLVGSAGYLLTVFAYNYYHLLFSFGVITGIGFGIGYIPYLVTVGVYFEKYRNLAFGIVNTAVGIGTIVFPFVIKLCVEHFSWRGAMLVLAGIYLHTCVCGAIFRPVPKARQESACKVLRKNDKTSFGSNLTLEACASIERGLNYSHQRDNSALRHSVMKKSVAMETTQTAPLTMNGESQALKYPDTHAETKPCFLSLSSQTKHLLRNANFLLLCVSLFLTNAGNFIPVVHFPAYAMGNGASVTDAATFISTMGVCGVFSRFLSGVVTNNRRIQVLAVYLCACFFCALLFYLSPIMLKSYPGQLAFAAGLGLWGNSCHALMAPLTVELFSIELLSSGLGIECLASGVGILIGPPLAGFIYDVSGTYAYSFFAAGCLYTSGFLLLLTIPICAKMRTTKAQRPGQKPEMHNGWENGATDDEVQAKLHLPTNYRQKA